MYLLSPSHHMQSCLHRSLFFHALSACLFACVSTPSRQAGEEETPYISLNHIEEDARSCRCWEAKVLGEHKSVEGVKHLRWIISVAALLKSKLVSTNNLQ
jgi:starvation-inducible outer membrane lipoprotein